MRLYYNPTAEHSLFSEYQLRDFGVKVNTISKKHGGEQNYCLMSRNSMRSKELSYLL